MAADDLAQEAIDELYGIDPEAFMQRRTALAAEARTAGAKAAAKEIAALRKPTRSAYTLNQLVRGEPDAADRLAELGADLRAAQEALDGGRMRELSTLRRGLVEELADRAFEVTDQHSPAAGLREDVVSTLNAAVADEGVVEQLRSGALIRPARWDGFGFASPPELSVVRPTPARAPRSAPKGDRPSTATGRGAKDTPTRAGGAAGSAAARSATAGSAAARKAAEAAERAEAEQQRQREVRVEAEEILSTADAGLAEATRAEDEQRTQVKVLQEQVTDARHRLDELRIELRRAETRQRKARQAVERLPT